MNTGLRNIIAVIAGILIGSAVNMAIIMVSGSIIPPPKGTDLTTVEGLEAAMPLMEAKHFLFPFLAHALGTLVGAFIAVLMAATNKMRYSTVIGLIFLVGGILNVMMLPSPIWFTIVDLVFAYIPFAYVGGKLAFRRSN